MSDFVVRWNDKFDKGSSWASGWVSSGEASVMNEEVAFIMLSVNPLVGINFSRDEPNESDGSDVEMADEIGFGNGWIDAIGAIGWITGLLMN